MASKTGNLGKRLNALGFDLGSAAVGDITWAYLSYMTRRRFRLIVGFLLVSCLQIVIPIRPAVSLLSFSSAAGVGDMPNNLLLTHDDDLVPSWAEFHHELFQELAAR